LNQQISAGSFTVEPSVNNHFAWIRTRLAIERTLMAWIRTAISLIGFGFTIVQFFQRLQGMNVPGLRVMRPQAPRDLGLALIATGVGVLAGASWQYVRDLRYLRSGCFEIISVDEPRAYCRPAFLAAMVLLAIGLAAFFSVLFRLA
jgi:putative membrane protein